MGFLNESGLEHFWDRISDKFSITKIWENASPNSIITVPEGQNSVFIGIPELKKVDAIFIVADTSNDSLSSNLIKLPPTGSCYFYTKYRIDVHPDGDKLMIISYRVEIQNRYWLCAYPANYTIVNLGDNLPLIEYASYGFTIFPNEIYGLKSLK